MEVDKVAEMEVEMVAGNNINIEIHLVRELVTGLVNWAKTFLI